jgi:hypothetical protein
LLPLTVCFHTLNFQQLSNAAAALADAVSDGVILRLLLLLFAQAERRFNPPQALCI